MKDIRNQAHLAFQHSNDEIILIGETLGWLGQSLYLREIENREEGGPPPVDLSMERRNGDFVRSLIESEEVNVCHDVSDGGVLVAIAEMSIASGIGAKLTPPKINIPLFSWAFGEDQARYIIAANNSEHILQAARKADVTAEVVGTTGGSTLTLGSATSISVRELRNCHRNWLEHYMQTR